MVWVSYYDGASHPLDGEYLGWSVLKAHHMLLQESKVLAFRRLDKIQMHLKWPHYLFPIFGWENRQNLSSQLQVTTKETIISYQTNHSPFTQPTLCSLCLVQLLTPWRVYFHRLVPTAQFTAIAWKLGSCLLSHHAPWKQASTSITQNRSSSPSLFSCADLQLRTLT